MRARADNSLEAVTQEAAAFKAKLQEVTSGQAEAARLAGDLDVERNLLKEAKSHVATLESRSVLDCSSWCLSCVCIFAHLAWHVPPSSRSIALLQAGTAAQVQVYSL